MLCSLAIAEAIRMQTSTERMTVGQNIELLWKQADFDFSIGHCLVSDEISAY